MHWLSLTALLSLPLLFTACLWWDFSPNFLAPNHQLGAVLIVEEPKGVELFIDVDEIRWRSRTASPNRTQQPTQRHHFVIGPEGLRRFDRLGVMPSLHPNLVKLFWRETLYVATDSDEVYQWDPERRGLQPTTALSSAYEELPRPSDIATAADSEELPRVSYYKWFHNLPAEATSRLHRLRIRIENGPAAQQVWAESTDEEAPWRSLLLEVKHE